MKIGRWILLALILGAAGFAVYRYRFDKRPAEGAPVAEAPQLMVPPGTRIKVEVLNATKVRGLARRATFFLRDRGFDVVSMGTSRLQSDSTLVLDRSGHPEWASLVAKALNAKVQTRLDSSRYLDVTVLIGSNWRPPALPFYP
ncbi:MAG TPA: LytR C-terminal domain-containing protein [Gemmatimonadaceae bacterium]|nr:LytR C-terminal domain-containing protein [Gemmatimonadaceae bacterium]